MQNKMTALVKDFFKNLNISIDSIKIVETDIQNTFNIVIKTNESWIIIWANGKNVDAIQNILKIMLSKMIWEKIRLNLKINDYIKTKDDRLFDFIKKEIEYVKKTWKEIKLPHYSSYERKKIHWFVHSIKDDSINTKSKWEWKERRLYIYKEKTKLTIDIDWDDI